MLNSELGIAFYGSLMHIIWEVFAQADACGRQFVM